MCFKATSPLLLLCFDVYKIRDKILTYTAEEMSASDFLFFGDILKRSQTCDRMIVVTCCCLVRGDLKACEWSRLTCFPCLHKIDNLHFFSTSCFCSANFFPAFTNLALALRIYCTFTADTITIKYGQYNVQ